MGDSGKGHQTPFMPNINFLKVYVKILSSVDFMNTILEKFMVFT